MLLTSLLDRFPLMAKMALRWLLLARKASCQSSLLTNAPAHTPSQFSRHLAQAPGPCSQVLALEGASLSFAHCAPAALDTCPSLECPEPPPTSDLRTGCSSRSVLPHTRDQQLLLALRVSAKMSPPPRFPISKVNTSVLHNLG